MHILLIERYYTQYPPLGLLKLSSLHKAKGDTVEFVSLKSGFSPVVQEPDQVYVTSLFTYSWKPVHQAVEECRKRFPRARIVLGGIYATLMPAHAATSLADEIRPGIVEEAEDLLPDYSLVPLWEAGSIVFSHRGCIRKCLFCAVPKMEPHIIAKKSLRHLIHPDHKRVILWDNNILGTANWRDIIGELRDMDLAVDFNQGLDARLITEEVAYELRGLRIKPIRMAYDLPGEKKALERAIPTLEQAGFKRRQMTVYALYNYEDAPDEFLDRIRDLLEWGVVVYPMRFEPVDSLKKNQHVGSK
jgi:hypothetical protein